jgi:hypothetical protein
MMIPSRFLHDTFDAVQFDYHSVDIKRRYYCVSSLCGVSTKSVNPCVHKADILLGGSEQGATIT